MGDSNHDTREQALLIDAATDGDLAQIQELVSQKRGNLNPKYGWAPLHFACLNEHLERFAKHDCVTAKFGQCACATKTTKELGCNKSNF